MSFHKIEAKAYEEYKAISWDKAWELNDALLELAREKGRIGFSFITDSRGIFRAGGVTEPTFSIMSKFSSFQFRPDQTIEAVRRQHRTVDRAVALFDCSRLREGSDFLGTVVFDSSSMKDASKNEDLGLVRQALWRVSKDKSNKLYSDLGVALSNRLIDPVLERCSFCDWRVSSERRFGFCTLVDSTEEAQKAAQMFQEQGMYTNIYRHHQIDLLGIAGCKEHTGNMRKLEQSLDRYSHLLPEMLEDAKTP